MSEAQTGRLPRREREKLRHREEILEVALELFSNGGYHNVSMNEIAEKAEFAVGTLYNFFKNKEDLYKALMLAKAESFYPILADPLQESDPLKSLQKYIETRWRLFTENTSVWRLYFSETSGASFNLKSGLDQEILQVYDRLMNKLTAVFKSGVQKNIFRGLDPYCMAVALEGTISAFLFRSLEKPELLTTHDGLSTVTEIFLGGVLNK